MEVGSEDSGVGEGWKDVSKVIASRSCWICSAPGCIAHNMNDGSRERRRDGVAR